MARRARHIQWTYISVQGVELNSRMLYSRWARRSQVTKLIKADAVCSRPFESSASLVWLEIDINSAIPMRNYRGSGSFTSGVAIHPSSFLSISYLPCRTDTATNLRSRRRRRRRHLITTKRRHCPHLLSLPLSSTRSGCPVADGSRRLP